MGISIADIRRQAVTQAQEYIQMKPVYLDTETTGLNKNDEIVEIAIIDADGSLLLDELVKPKKMIPQDAYRIHGIDNAMVATARSWPLLWPLVREILINRPIGIYNVEFDLRLMRQSFDAYNLPWKDTLNTFDILLLFARFYGEWDSYRRSFRFQSLENAAKYLGLPVSSLHRAKDDAQLTRAVLHAIAETTD